MNIYRLNQFIQDIKNNKPVRKGDLMKLKASEYIEISYKDPEVGKKVFAALVRNLENKGRLRLVD